MPINSTLAAACSKALGFTVNPNIPTAALNLNFTTGTLDSRITFTRSTTGSYYNSSGVLTQAAVNLLTYSEQFDNAVWVKSNTTVTANAIVAPDGNTTADKLVEDTASSTHNVRCVYNATNTTLTFSCYFKAAERSKFIMQISNTATGAAQAYFDLTTGTYSSVSNNGDFTATTANIQPLSNGWYRCSLTTTKGSYNTACLPFIFLLDNTGNNNYTGNGTSGLYIWGAQLETGSVATTYIPTTSSISGAPRFDYNPFTLQAKGLLIEESRTNLLTYSEQFDNAVWAKTNATVTANATTAPDGNATADSLIETATTGNHSCTQSGKTVTAGAILTFSCYAKNASGSRWIMLAVSGTSGSAYCHFNPSTGVSGVSGVSGTYTGVSSATSSIGNGWYRFSVSFTSASDTSVTPEIRLKQTDNGVSSYTGDGTSGIYLWGAQLEAGSFATSYIPTVASQVTRAADVAVMTGTNFSSWYNQTEGTVYADVISCAANTIAQVTVQFSDGTALNRIVTRRNTSGYIATAVVDNNVTQGDISVTSSIAGNAEYKTATGIKAANSAIAVNGSLGGSITTGTIPLVLNKLDIGQNLNTQYVNGCIKRITYYNKRLTNQQLQYLTR